MSDCKFLKSVKNFSTTRVPFSSNHRDTGLRRKGKRRERNHPNLNILSSPIIIVFININNIIIYKPVVTFLT